MKLRKGEKTFDHSGSSFVSFLDEEGIRAEIESMAVKRVPAWQRERVMKKRQKIKQARSSSCRSRGVAVRQR
jgi:hypothetical protein